MLKYAGDASDACSVALGEAGEATGQSKEWTIDGNYAIERRGGRHIHASGATHARGRRARRVYKQTSRVKCVSTGSHAAKRTI